MRGPHPNNPLLRQHTYEGKNYYYYWCPGCNEHHCFDDGWKIENWNPLTVHPSILVYFPERKSPDGKVTPRVTLCHVFIKQGRIQFLPDCQHELKGQTVPMEPFHADQFHD